MLPRTRRNLLSLFQWHRHVGLVALVLVLVLAATGLLLNHTDRLALDSRYIASDFLLDWYGIEAAPLGVAYRTGDHWLSEIGGRVYFDTRPLTAEATGLVGAVALDQMIVVAVQGGLLLLTEKGQLIERLGGVHGIPAGLKAIGRTAAGGLLAEGAHGAYRAGPALLDWKRYTGGSAPVWSQAAKPPSELVAKLQRHQRQHVLPLERVLLDLHSGRIIASWGVYVMDVAALLLVFLGITGTWLWVTQQRKQRLHRKAHR